MSKRGKKPGALIVELPLNLPEPRVVANLESLLEQAKRGELRAFAFVAERANRGFAYGISGNVSPHRAVGMLEELKFDILFGGGDEDDDDG